MCTDRLRRQHGLTMIELIMFMIIIGVAVAGVLAVINLTTSRSGDPQQRKQALAIAEGLLEEIELARFTYCDPSDTKAATAASTADCSTVESVGPESGETRPYDNVNDYVAQYGTPVSLTTNVDGSAFPAGYSAQVTISPEALNGITSDASNAGTEVLQITVTVSYAGGSITLDGYRTRYDPNAVP